MVLLQLVDVSLRFQRRPKELGDVGFRGRRFVLAVSVLRLLALVGGEKGARG